ncbi:M23 family metallopeptidase [Streptomyces sp. HB2AG]|uniref:M23 family metallopeptidase n=1 Tax=Streptomyces sp. HB2AG TaxID=2983400 RepID=UPI0022AB3779|nr:M23 family metallopeptidase [Streptomyces sp. HB2AG]MCZ2523763.1 M23 family metallopeptidase [Streptomyces sp. HB2AG]
MAGGAGTVSLAVFRSLMWARPRLAAGGAVLAAGGALLLSVGGEAGAVRAVAGAGAVALGAAAVLAACCFVFAPRAPRREAAVLRPPLAGPWVRASRHGPRPHTLARSFAVELAPVPGPGEPPARGGPSGAGAVVLAPADGTVVAVHGTARDHRTGTGVAGAVRAAAGRTAGRLLREAFGARAVFGNHIVLDLHDGTHVLLAHLRRGSIRVTVGEEVRVGRPLAGCGTSGSVGVRGEPRLHVQVMDRPWPGRAAVGVPLVLREGNGAGGGPGHGLESASGSGRGPA